jgi:AhpD family alkylhydroperoxidase
MLKPTASAEASLPEERHIMPQDMFPSPTPDLAMLRKKLAPHVHDAFTAFSDQVFADGALPTKTKQLIAVAAAHITQCPYCIRGHTKAALRHGATAQEIMEAIWVAAEMRAGGACAHSVLALAMIKEVTGRQEQEP